MHLVVAVSFGTRLVPIVSLDNIINDKPPPHLAKNGNSKREVLFLGDVL